MRKRRAARGKSGAAQRKKREFFQIGRVRQKSRGKNGLIARGEKWDFESIFSKTKNVKEHFTKKGRRERLKGAWRPFSEKSTKKEGEKENDYSNDSR